MTMGRLVYKKGFSYLLRAAPVVLGDYPDTLFVVAGDGGLRPELEGLAESLQIQKHVLFTGHIPWGQTPSFLTMADIFVVPSVQDQAGNLDGLPNVLLESMASGCAIVASNVAGIPEVVQDDKNGLLTPQGDERALAHAICRLLSDRQLRHRLGGAARETAIEKLSWVHVGVRIAAILQTCV
jgi:glycosyltransferase involved in cell wall biosynthesis